MIRKNKSEQLKDFLNLINNVESEYQYYSDLLSNEDKITQDLLHKLELENTGYKERNKIATVLATCRKDRRFYKDQIEELQPLHDFLNDQKHKQSIEQLKQVLGKIRKAEDYHKNRCYYPRILRDAEE